MAREFMNRERILNELDAHTMVYNVRMRNLAEVRDKMVSFEQHRARLEAQAAHWEAGVDSAEQAIAELEHMLEEYPLDMSATGEADEDAESWESAGYSID